MTLGLGRDALVRIPTERAIRARPEALRAAIAADRAAGRRPIAIVATLGTTSSTSVDPVAAIADIAEREGAVAARRRGLCRRRSRCCPTGAAPFAGWERADSIVVNPHKWLFTPLDASLLLTRRMAVLAAAFSLVPEYLRTLDRAAPVRDYNEYTPQLGRRFRALKLWIQLRWFGLDGLRRRIRAHLELAECSRRGSTRTPTGSAWRPSRSRRSASAGTRRPRPDDADARRRATRRSWTRSTGPARSSCPTPGSPGGSRSGSRSATCGPSRATSSARGRCCARRPPLSPKPEPHDVRYFATPEELRDWFDANHETADELWLGYYRKSTGRPSVDWSQAVDEALCVGWIDGVRYSLDDERFVQRFTPRRKGSNWSAINVAKVADVDGAGRMRPAGLAAFEAQRSEAKTGDLLVRTQAARRSRRRRRRASAPTRRPGPIGSADRRRIGARCTTG